MTETTGYAGVNNKGIAEYATIGKEKCVRFRWYASSGLLADMLNEAVIPAKAGIQGFGGLPASMQCSTRVAVYWIPGLPRDKPGLCPE